MSSAVKPAALLATPVLLAGGTEMQTLTLTTILIAAGWAVTVCCYHESDPAVVAAFERAGARVVRLGLSRRLGLMGVAGRLVAAFRALRPDVVHVQYLAPGFTAVLAARAAGARNVFATVHQPGTVYGARERLLLRSASRMCTAFFAVSLAVERSWFGDAALFDPDRPRGGRRHGTVYNAVDAPAVAAAVLGADRDRLRRSRGVSAGEHCIGFVGRVRREKGLDLLIRALPGVAAAFPDTRLLVIGDGPEQGALRELARRTGVADRVIWAGVLLREEAWRHLAVLDLVAAPSRFEGFSLAAAEAQAAGLPVVAADVGGLAEVVAGGETGLLVPPEDHRALTEAIVRLLGDPTAAREMGRRGQARVRDLFSAERFARATLVFYDTARASGTAGRS